MRTFRGTEHFLHSIEMHKNAPETPKLAPFLQTERVACLEYAASTCSKGTQIIRGIRIRTRGTQITCSFLQTRFWCPFGARTGCPNRRGRSVLRIEPVSGVPLAPVPGAPIAGDVLFRGTKQFLLSLWCLYRVHQSQGTFCSTERTSFWCPSGAWLDVHAHQRDGHARWIAWVPFNWTERVCECSAMNKQVWMCCVEQITELHWCDQNNRFTYEPIMQTVTSFWFINIWTCVGTEHKTSGSISCEHHVSFWNGTVFSQVKRNTRCLGGSKHECVMIFRTEQSKSHVRTSLVHEHLIELQRDANRFPYRGYFTSFIWPVCFLASFRFDWAFWK